MKICLFKVDSSSPLPMGNSLPIRTMKDFLWVQVSPIFCKPLQKIWFMLFVRMLSLWWLSNVPGAKGKHHFIETITMFRDRYENIRCNIQNPQPTSFEPTYSYGPLKF